MSYLLDKKIKRKKFFSVVFFVIIFLFLFYFRLSIFNNLSYASHKIFRPVLIFGNNLSEKFFSFGSFFISKNSLYLQNQNLQSQLNEERAKMSNYNSLLEDNASLKEILNRKDVKTNMVLSVILSKPNQSPFDTLIIDAGIKQGLQIGNMVFAFGNVPIGRVGLVYENSSKVILFSNVGEKTQAMISGKLALSTGENIFLELIGRGGGNFEMILPRDFTPAKGDQVILPSINSYVFAIVETIISDPRDSFTKALLVSPVNIQELKFVEVEI